MGKTLKDSGHELDWIAERRKGRSIRDLERGVYAGKKAAKEKERLDESEKMD